MVNIAGIRFKKAGKIYYFDAGEIPLQAGDYAVVKTSRGMEMGHVVIAPGQIEVNETGESLSPVVRKAEPEDIAKEEELNAKAKESLIECGKMIAELNLPMKLLSAEYNLDGSRITFFFSAAERVDFRELVRELSKHFKIRVELRQVGSRDESKLIGGFGRCGRPLCCMSYLSEFSPVSIRMAKDQGLSLNPMRISGVCGRLLCCLGYEGELYQAMKKKLPREKQRVSVPMGIAKVVSGNPLKETILVELESGARVEVPLSEVTIIDK